MIKSIGPGSFATPTLEEAFKKAQELGFEGFEFMLTAPANHLYLSYESNEEDYARIRALAKTYDINVHSVMTTHYNTTQASFGSPKGSEKYNEALRILRKQIECAKGIGATAILVVPNLDLDVGYKKSIDNTIETFRELEDEIKEAGIHIGLENIWNRFFLSPFDAKYVIEGINNPLVGIYLDIGNVLDNSLPDFWIEVLAPYIKRIHVKDFKRANGFQSGGYECELFEGDLDFETVIPKLRAAGYDGPISLEMANHKEGRSREQYLIDLSNQIEKIVSYAK